jgi:hypothetical protein
MNFIREYVEVTMHGEPFHIRSSELVITNPHYFFYVNCMVRSCVECQMFIGKRKL